MGASRAVGARRGGGGAGRGGEGRGGGKLGKWSAELSCSPLRARTHGCCCELIEIVKSFCMGPLVGPVAADCMLPDAVPKGGCQISACAEAAARPRSSRLRGAADAADGQLAARISCAAARKQAVARVRRGAAAGARRGEAGRRRGGGRRRELGGELGGWR